MGTFCRAGAFVNGALLLDPASPDFPGEGDTADLDRSPGAILPTGNLCVRLIPRAVDSAAPARSRCTQPPANGARVRVDRVCVPRSLHCLAHDNSAARFKATSDGPTDAPGAGSGYGPERLPFFACLARDLLRTVFRAASEIGEATGSGVVVDVPDFGGDTAYETARRS